MNSNEILETLLQQLSESVQIQNVRRDYTADQTKVSWLDMWTEHVDMTVAWSPKQELQLYIDEIGVDNDRGYNPPPDKVVTTIAEAKAWFIVEIDKIIAG